MAIPIATTTVSVLRLTPGAELQDPYEEPTSIRTVVETNVRAHIGSPAGAAYGPASSQEVVRWRFDSDIADINHLDWVRDDVTGDVYRLSWIRRRTGLGLDHMEGELIQVTGVVDI